MIACLVWRSLSLKRLWLGFTLSRVSPSKALKFGYCCCCCYCYVWERCDLLYFVLVPQIERITRWTATIELVIRYLATLRHFMQGDWKYQDNDSIFFAVA